MEDTRPTFESVWGEVMDLWTPKEIIPDSNKEKILRFYLLADPQVNQAAEMYMGGFRSAQEFLLVLEEAEETHLHRTPR